MSFLWLFPIVAFFSLILTGLLRRYALAKSVLDIPNARSSHSVPTPRGGGVAIVATFLLSLAVLWEEGSADQSIIFALLGSGALVAILGFMDDHGHIAARWRLLGHFLAAAWVLVWIKGLPVLRVFGLDLEFGWLGFLFAAVYLVWMLNLYNFMDGVDGIASVEAITVCLGACALYLFSDFDQLLLVPLLLVMAVVGFLYWNFPPARIFMGDAGSGFLGIVLGALSLQAAWVSQKLFWCWLILLGIFVVDATFTLLRRLIRGEKVYEAHRSHAYQFASREYGSHLPVALAVALINVLWLLPVSLSVLFFDVDGVLGVVVAYVPLLFLALRYRAGALE